jgi:pyruvate/2-oxoglutarate dehydrogenase complex dihydrolipoamide dehydrogenase (E3) component
MLNTVADRSLVESMTPDALIIAIGATVNELPIKGADGPNVMQIVDFIEEEPEIGDEVVIIGGGAVGCEIALELSKSGKQVHIVEYGNRLAPNGNVLYYESLMKHIGLAENLDYQLNSECYQINDDGVLIHTKDGDKEIKASNVLLSVGMHSKLEEAEQFYGITPQTYYVGDCHKVASVMEATNDAYFIAASL